MGRLLAITQLTLHEALRRRVLTAALLGGLAFLALYATGFHFVAKEALSQKAGKALESRLILNFFTLAGLYAANFLGAIAGVLLPIDTLAGEISSGVMQTVASRPVRRSEILLGKWLAYVLVCSGYLLLVAGGVLAVAWGRAHFVPPNPIGGLALMVLEVTCLVSLSLAGGTRLSTVTNGVLAFALYGLAFIGGWIEQIAAFTGNVAARNVGTVASLLVPTESLWQRASFTMQPRIMAELHFSPFSPASLPSPAMVWWAGGWAVVMVLLALRGFARRGL